MKNKHRMSVLHDREFSPMARATRTKTRREKSRKRDRWDRKGKHRGEI